MIEMAINIAMQVAEQLTSNQVLAFLLALAVSVLLSMVWKAWIWLLNTLTKVLDIRTRALARARGRRTTNRTKRN